MVVSEQASHWDYFHLLGSFEDKQKFNYAVKLYILFTNNDSDEETRDYILSRVIQALGAMSNSMRAGAFSLFCTLLVNCPQQCKFETLMKLIKNHFKPSGSSKPDAEAYVGQILAYKAIFQAGLLDPTPRLYGEIADGLMELSMKKSYLHGEALTLLGKITEKTHLEYGTEAFLGHLQNLNDGTLDKLYYLLKVDQCIENSETLFQIFKGKRLLSSDNATEIGNLVANCYNATHKFFDAFLDAISENHKYLNKFWKAYESNVQDKLGSNKVALETYYTLMNKILQKMLSKNQYKPANTLVSNVAVESLIKHSKSKAELTKSICKSIGEVVTKANDSNLSTDILNKLVFSPGSFSFDEDTGTRVVSTVWRSLGTEEAKEFGDKCLDSTVKGNRQKNKDRFNALNFYCSLLNSPAVLLENEWRIRGMKILLETGLLNGPNVSAELATAIRKSFFNTLSIKFPNLPAYAEALKTLVKCLEKCLNKEDNLRIKVTDEMKSAWKLSHKLISSLEKKISTTNEKNQVIVQALELLTGFIALKSIYEPKDAQFNLTDIKSVFERITKSDNSSEGPEWIEVLMDLFLNMLSKPNVSNRTIINIVFKTMVPHLNDGAFLQMIDVLNPSYDLNKTENSDEAIEEEGSGEEQESSQDETESEDDSSEPENEEESEVEGVEIEDSDEIEGSDEDMGSRSFNQEKLQFELRKALTPANDSDNESINIDDMDEEQGRQLDATLSAIFKRSMMKKKPSKKESVTSHFKTRVIDLLETYCLMGMPLVHWGTLIPTILKLANSVVAPKNMVGLKQRVLSFVRKASSAKISDISSEDCDTNGLVNMYKELMTQASNASGTALDLKQHYLEFIKLCIRNTNYAHAQNKDVMRESLNDVVGASIEHFFCEKNSLQPEVLMFLCQYHWCGVHDATYKVMESTFSQSTKHFKRSQGLSLLTGYYKSDRLFTTISEPEGKSMKKIHDYLLERITNLVAECALDAKTQHLIVSLIVEVCNSKGTSHLKWKKWKQSLPQLLVVPKNKKELNVFETMCKKLGLERRHFKTVANIPNAQVRKEMSQPSDKANKKEGKKRKQVDARKLKKESKRLRLAAMDGLDNFSWSKLSTDD